MESQLKSLEQRLDDQNQQQQQRLNDQNQRMMDQSKIFEEQMNQMMRLLVETRHANPPPRQLGYVPKLEFPSFNGENSRTWIQKCEKYFQLCKIPEEQKVDIAGIHLSGKAESWFNAYMAARAPLLKKEQTKKIEDSSK